jgi:hypothetical protein
MKCDRFYISYFHKFSRTVVILNSNSVVQQTGLRFVEQKLELSFTLGVTKLNNLFCECVHFILLLKSDLDVKQMPSGGALPQLNMFC